MSRREPRDLGRWTPPPAHLAEWLAAELAYCPHSPAWRRHRERSGLVDVALPDGWRYWLDLLKLIAPQNETEIKTIETDTGRNFGYAHVVGRRRPQAQLIDLSLSLPAEYHSKPLLRDSAPTRRRRSCVRWL